MMALRTRRTAIPMYVRSAAAAIMKNMTRRKLQRMEMTINFGDCVAEFERVSLDEYLKARIGAISSYDAYGENMLVDELTKEWQNLIMPRRATSGSAGYDFYLPYDVCLTQTPQVIHTGICCDMDPGWVLLMFPRSGLAFKYGVRLSNSVGVIDEDYIHADNEGHIAARIYAADKPVSLKAGDRFMQGILLPYGIAFGDRADEHRHGGMGSTGTR